MDDPLSSLADRILTYEHLIEKANVSSNERFVETTAEEETSIIEEQKNDNTRKKTVSDVKCFTTFLKTKNEAREIFLIAPPELDKYLANFLLSVRTPDRKEYEPQSLTSKFNSIGRYLRDNSYNHEIKTSPEFAHSRQVLEAKKKQLKASGRGNKPNAAAPMERSDFEQLKTSGQIGTGRPIYH